MRTIKPYSIVLVAIAVTGLNVATVNAEQTYISKEQSILVKEFTIQEAQVKGDNSKDAVKVAAKKERVPQKLVNVIVEQLRKSGFRAAPYTSATEASGTLVLDGSISLIHNGSGSARVWVGFGAGKAKMIATIRLYYTDNPSEIFASEKIKAASIGAAGVFGGGGNREDAVNRNFARKVVSLLEDMKIPVSTANEIVQALEKESLAPTNEARISDAAKPSPPSQQSSVERDDTIVGTEATNEQDGARQETIAIPLAEQESLSASSSDEVDANSYGYLRWEYNAQSSSDIVIELISTSLEFDERISRGDSQVSKARSGEHDIQIHDVADGRRDKPNWQDYSFKIDILPLTITRILITVNDQKSNNAFVVTVVSDGQEIMRRSIEAD